MLWGLDVIDRERPGVDKIEMLGQKYFISCTEVVGEVVNVVP